MNQAAKCTACGNTIGGQNKHGSAVPEGNTVVDKAAAQKLIEAGGAQKGPCWTIAWDASGQRPLPTHPAG